MTSGSAEWVAAARLARRLGFGATGSTVDAVLREGRPAYLDRVLATDVKTDRGVLATPAPDLAFVERVKAGGDAAKRQASQTQLRQERQQLVAWWLRRMSVATEPWVERRTFYWHNHFATSLAKVQQPAMMLRQNQTLRSLGGGTFHDLAHAVLTDAAMLRWLDGNKNTKAAPNENLSREFMELFALGHGDGYTEDDVKQGARALTGWVIDPDGSTSLRPTRHDDGVKTFLGVTGNLDASGFADAVLARPQSATYVLGRMWRSLVSPTPPSAATLAAVLAAYGPSRDLTAAVRSMMTSPELTSTEGSQVVSPVEWAVGAVRALHVDLSDDRTVRRLATSLRTLGQLPFYPPSVGGWPGGQAWLSAASLGIRLSTGQALAAKGDLSAVEGVSQPERLAAVGHLLGIAGWSDRSAAALRPYAAKPAALVAVALNTAEYLVH